MKKIYCSFIISFLLQLNSFAQDGWNIIYSFGSDVWSITFKDSLNGIAVSSFDLPKVFKTTDGGIIWNDINIANLNVWISDIIFLENNTYIGVGYETIIKSTDGGNSWTLKNIGDDATLSSICSTEDGKLFACCFDGRIYKSIDEGENWDIKNTGISSLRYIAFSNENEGFCLGSYDVAIKTTDGGEPGFPSPFLHTCLVQSMLLNLLVKVLVIA